MEGLPLEGPTFWKTVWVAAWYSFSFCSRSSLLASACSSGCLHLQAPVLWLQECRLPCWGRPTGASPCGAPGWYRESGGKPTPDKACYAHAEVRSWAQGSHHGAGSDSGQGRVQWCL